ncbi:transcriptional regulator [bacterium]|nr:MAG: transcriptional regulator [bacterium]
MDPQKYWRQIPARYRLEAYKCKNCGKVFFPKRLICDNCKSREFVKAEHSDKGKLLTYTVIRTGPADFQDQTPYVIGVVESENGARLTAQIADVEPENVAIGMKLRMAFRKINKTGDAGVIMYGYKAVPEFE